MPKKLFFAFELNPYPGQVLSDDLVVNASILKSGVYQMITTYNDKVEKQITKATVPDKKDFVVEIWVTSKTDDSVRYMVYPLKVSYEVYDENRKKGITNTIHILVNDIPAVLPAAGRPAQSRQIIIDSNHPF